MRFQLMCAAVHAQAFSSRECIKVGDNTHNIHCIHKSRAMRGD